MSFLGILIGIACFFYISDYIGGGKGITDVVKFSNRTYVFTNLSNHERQCLKQTKNYGELAAWMRTFNKWQD